MMLPIRDGSNFHLVRFIRTFVAKYCHPVHLAIISAILFFVANYRISVNAPDVFAQHVIYTSIFFVCVWLICNLFRNGIDRRLHLEGVNRETVGVMIYTFVIYLEIIKHTVGVSFVLGWVAGILACWEYLGVESLVITVSACLIVSLISFIVTYGVSNLLDELRWPDNEDS